MRGLKNLISRRYQFIKATYRKTMAFEQLIRLRDWDGNVLYGNVPYGILVTIGV